MNKKTLTLLISALVSVALITSVIIIAPKLVVNSDDGLPTYVVSFNTNGGSEIPNVFVKKGKKISKPTDPYKQGFHVKDWLYNNKPWVFETNEVNDNMTLTATWDYNSYTIAYDFLGGHTEEEYRTTYDMESEFELIRPIKNDYVFGGWFNQNGQRIDRINKGTIGNLSLTARWIENLVIMSLDETRGTINVYSDEHDANKVIVKNIPINNKYHVFDGWYDENDKLLSNEQIFAFELNNQKTTIVKSKYMTDLEENTWNLSHGVAPILDEINNSITFGMYPQSNVNGAELINELERSIQTDFNNYYYHNHEYYLKKKASLYASEGEQYLSIHNFDNGTEITDGISYWFKVEPIHWKILENNENRYSIMSQKLLDKVRYYEGADIREIEGISIYPNNYKYSTIRKWMNEDFLNNAFNFNKQPLSKVIVNNNSSTTAIENNRYACENTEDYVYALSYEDYLRPEYGFTNTINSTSARTFKTTDLARASGVQYSTNEVNTYCGYAWTRSPYYTNSETRPGLSVSRISQGGTINTSWNGANYSCAQPCINITL